MTTRVKSEGVPAVLHTVAILRYLQDVGNKPTPMMEIARALEINTSTCFNILKTLASQRILSYDEDTRKYTLGLALIELASLVDNYGHLLAAAQAQADIVARETNQVCLIFRKTSDDAFLVVGKAEGRTTEGDRDARRPDRAQRRRAGEGMVPVVRRRRGRPHDRPARAAVTRRTRSPAS